VVPSPAYRSLGSTLSKRRGVLRRDLATLKLSHMRILMLALATSVLNFGLIGLAAQTAAPASPAVSRVHQLETEDQSENPGEYFCGGVLPTWRCAPSRSADALCSRKTYLERRFLRRALIFQHRRTAEDFLFAHVLAMQGLMRGGSADKWIAAATLDRYLRSINQPQGFGTQYTGEKSAGNTPKPQVDPHAINIQRTLQPYDSKLLPDAVRQDFCVPDESQQEKNLAIQHWSSSTGRTDAGRLCVRTSHCQAKGLARNSVPCDRRG